MSAKEIGRGDSLDGGKIVVVGLGNPGPKYESTRHNVGFMAVDRLASRWMIDVSRSKFNAKLGTGHGAGRQVVLLKPQTFMNLSGQSVSRAAQFFGAGLGAIVVIHDDIDLPFGAIRLKRGGGTGGHNGLKSIDRQLGDKAYFRVRLGVGRPRHGDTAAYVLKPFADAERVELDDVIAVAVDAICSLIEQGLQKSQNQFHSSGSLRQ